MKPKYYPYYIREDVLNGMYDTKTTDEDLHIKKVVRLFSSEKRTFKAMSDVIKKWKKSTEHNLTNTSKNRIAWIGQAACCLKLKAPDYITRKAWWILPKEKRDKADSIAKMIIKEYENSIRNECTGSGKTENQLYF